MTAMHRTSTPRGRKTAGRRILASRRARAAMIALGALLPLGTAHAYVGPGLGLGTIVVILGTIGSIFLAIFGVVWYPIKRMLKKRKAAEGDDAPTDAGEPVHRDEREAAES